MFTQSFSIKSEWSLIGNNFTLSCGLFAQLKADVRVVWCDLFVVWHVCRYGDMAWDYLVGYLAGVRSLTVLLVAAIISWIFCIASKDYCLMSTVSLVAHVRKGSESGVSGSWLDLACVLPFRRLCGR